MKSTQFSGRAIMQTYKNTKLITFSYDEEIMQTYETF